MDANAEANKQGESIAKIYEALGTDLEKGVGATGQIFENARGGVSGAYNSGISEIQALTGGLENRLSESANKLGMGTNLSGATQTLKNTLGAMQARMTGQRTADLGALAGQGAAYQAIAQRHVGDSQREGARVQSEARTKLLNKLYEYMGQKEKAQGDIELQKLANEAKLQQIRAQLAGQEGQQNLSLKMQQLKNAEAQQGNPMDALNAEYKGLQIEKMKRELSGLLAGKDSDYGKGSLGLNRYINAMGDEVSDQELNILNQIIAASADQSAQQGRAGNPVSASDLAMEILYGGNDDTQLVPEGFDTYDLETMLQIYFGDTR